VTAEATRVTIVSNARDAVADYVVGLAVAAPAPMPDRKRLVAAAPSAVAP
jgi:hypothetical protein